MQFKGTYSANAIFHGHNPYFIGMNLAIAAGRAEVSENDLSQSLFYWNEPCNIIISTRPYRVSQSHHPYFIGMNLAIKVMRANEGEKIRHNPYFIGMNLAIRVVKHTT